MLEEEAEPRPGPAPPLQVPEPTSSGTDLALLEEDLSMAAAALAEARLSKGRRSWEASGLVVKVVAKNFFRSLEEVG